jgi:hypothetical protein
MGSTSTCPLHPTPCFHTNIFFPNFFSLSFYFDYSLFFEKPGIIYKISLQFFYSFWEHVKTWVRQWVIPLHVPYTPLPIFHTKKLLLVFFSFFSIFMIPYSSTNPEFFTKLHFNFLKLFGSMSKLRLDNGLSLYMSPTPPLLFFTPKNYY